MVAKKNNLELRGDARIHGPVEYEDGRLYRDMKMQVLQRRYWEFAVIENRADGEKVLHEYGGYLLKK